MTKTGGVNVSEVDAARIFIGFWWLASIVLGATYSGSLVAFLTFPRMYEPVSSVENLLSRRASEEWTWGYRNGSFLEKYLEMSDSPRYRQLHEGAEKHNSLTDPLVLNRVKHGKHVLIDWRMSLSFLMQNDLLQTGQCYFSLSTEQFMVEPIAMFVAQDSPYLAIINAA